MLSCSAFLANAMRVSHSHWMLQLECPSPLVFLPSFTFACPSPSLASLPREENIYTMTMHKQRKRKLNEYFFVVFLICIMNLLLPAGKKKKILTQTQKIKEQTIQSILSTFLLFFLLLFFFSKRQRGEERTKRDESV